MKLVNRHVAWILILIADAGLVAWGAMAAALPDFLLGPGGTPILTAGYEGFSKGSWSELREHGSDGRQVHGRTFPNVRRL
jgi:hypothetical protein